MQKILIFALAFLSMLQSAIAQTEKNDPAAKKVLDKVRKKYEGYKSVEATFSLTIEMPDQAKQVQKGTVGQEGDMFRLDMDDQIIVSDTRTTWVYLKKDNEVQINNAEPPGSQETTFMTPKELLRRYEKGDYIYAITDVTTENGRKLTQIEFKPKDKRSEYSKMRVAIDEAAGSIQSVKAFGKDGARFTFAIVRFNPKKVFPKGYFQFDSKKYPGIKVEDLRI